MLLSIQQPALQTARRGFTLVELSIVLVIIGLLVAGIVVGKALVEQAEIRALGATIQGYQAAVGTFKGKYNCKPGDCRNATNFWGLRSMPCSGAGSVTGTGYDVYEVGTCNGNGNDAIRVYSGSPDNMYGGETLWLWQHLSNAELISEKLTGMNSGEGSSSHGYVRGVNGPSLLAENTAMILTDANSSHRIYVGTPLSTGSYQPRGPGLTVSEMIQLDTKFDDGRPLNGNFNNYYWPGAIAERCTINNSPGTTYKIDAPGRVCAISWIGAWL